MTTQEHIKEATQIVSDIIKDDLAERLRQQGHNNTGKLIASMDAHIKFVSDSIVAGFMMNDYWGYVNSGVSAERIPYRRGSGARKSKYITALIEYFKSKGLNDVTAKRAAFATATVHKREGMPTRASARFSKDGQRKGFLTNYIDNNNTIQSLLSDSIDDAINNQLNEIIETIQHGS